MKLMPEDKIEIFCDGACQGNGTANAIGGWGAVLQFQDRKKEFSGKITAELFRIGTVPITNQRAELLAGLNALKQIKSADFAIMLYSDSKYLTDCFNQKWFARWEENGWVNAAKEPVANIDLWKELIPFYVFYDVTFEYRSDEDPGIKRAHELAQKAVNS